MATKKVLPTIKATVKKTPTPKKEGTIYLTTPGKVETPYVAPKPTTPTKAPTPITATKTPEKKGIIESIANVALKPSVAIGNVITRGIEALTGNKYGRTTSEELAAKPAGKALGMGIAGATASLAVAGATSLISGIAAKSATAAVAKAAAGQTVLKTTTNIATGKVSQMTVNTVTLGKTTSFITKLAGAAKNPAVVVGGIVAAIGSYPFASFMKEEALQQTSFSANQAIMNGDVKGAEEALALQREILNPDIWKSIMESIPFVNILSNVKSYYKAAAQNVDVNAQRIETLKKKLADKEVVTQRNATAEQERIADEADPNAKWDKIYKEQEARREKERADDEAYYKKVDENRRIAEEQKRTADAKYWAKIQEEQDKKAEEKRKADDEYWAAIRKQKEENQPSKLKFGLLN